MKYIPAICPLESKHNLESLSFYSYFYNLLILHFGFINMIFTSSQNENMSRDKTDAELLKGKEQVLVKFPEKHFDTYF